MTKVHFDLKWVWASSLFSAEPRLKVGERGQSGRKALSLADVISHVYSP